MIIVLSGLARSGKDTAATILKDMLHNSHTIAYADYLKEITENCFGLVDEQMFGDDKESPIEGLPIRTRSGHVTTHNWTPRKLFQYLGTDIFRTVHPNCWVNVVKKKVLQSFFL